MHTYFFASGSPSFMHRFFPLLLLLAACQTSAPAENSVGAVVIPGPATTAPQPDLLGPQWQLFQLGWQPITLSGRQPVYLQLSTTESQVTGHAGCNRFRGTFEQAAADSLRFGPLLTTRMSCPEQPAEGKFLAALEATRSYRVVADTLRLYGATGSIPLAELLRSQ